jgi:hypothetical protein
MPYKTNKAIWIDEPTYNKLNKLRDNGESWIAFLTAVIDYWVIMHTTANKNAIVG